MLLDLRPAHARGDDLGLDATDALRAIESVGHPRPVLLACHPSSPTPFYSMLYARALEAGVVPLQVRNVADASALVPIAAVAGAQVVLHLHWLSAVLRTVVDEQEASARITAFGEELDRLIDAGVSIAWTIHNVLPHDARLPAAEVELRRAVAARASVVHVMADATVDVLAGQLAIPAERLVHVPHPSFLGRYPDWVDGLEARRLLRIGPGAAAVGMLGNQQPYKGLDAMLDALDATERRRPGVRLVIAGEPSPDELMQRLVARAIADPRVAIHPGRIPDDQVQVVMRGVDVVALPYRRVLNSAALLLALAFERPVVFPRDPALAEFADPALAVTYERGSADGLAEAIDLALSLPRDGVASAAARISAERAPAIVSAAFFRGLRERLDIA